MNLVNKAVKVLVGLFFLFGTQFALSHDIWPACEHSDSPSSCYAEEEDEPVKHLSFDLRSLERGVGILKKHPVPLSVLVPSMYWLLSDDNVRTIAGFNRPEMSERLVNAQMKWINWFRKDLERGEQTPKITVGRLTKTYQMITGESEDLKSEAYLKGVGLALSSVDIKYLTADVIAENSQIIHSLRETTVKDYPQNQNYGIKSFLKGQGDMKGEFILYVHDERLEKMLATRSRFLENAISRFGWEDIGLKKSTGAYDSSSFLVFHWLDAVRIYSMVKEGHPNIEEFNPEGVNYKLPEKEPILDVFDIGGTLTQVPTHNPVEYIITWPTLVPSTSVSDLRRYNNIYIIHSRTRKVGRAMFDTALSSLATRLKPEMTRQELLDLLAESWRKLALAHAFPDGNGRTLRLLINSLLMAYGLPPLSCQPDCLPYSYTYVHFKREMESAMRLTQRPSEKSKYPEWLVNLHKEKIEKMIGR